MDDYSYVILQTYSNRGVLSLYDLSLVLEMDSSFLSGFVLNLCRQNLLRPQMPDQSISNAIPLKAKLEISSAGLSALNLDQKKRQHSRMSNIRSWISLILSVIAIIVSILH